MDWPTLATGEYLTAPFINIVPYVMENIRQFSGPYNIDLEYTTIASGITWLCISENPKEIGGIYPVAGSYHSHRIFEIQYRNPDTLGDYPTWSDVRLIYSGDRLYARLPSGDSYPGVSGDDMVDYVVTNFHCVRSPGT